MMHSSQRLLESDARSADPVVGGHRQIIDLQRHIQNTIVELNSVRLAKEQEQPSCSTSRGRRFSSAAQPSTFNVEDGFYVCRNCKTHIALKRDFCMPDDKCEHPRESCLEMVLKEQPI